MQGIWQMWQHQMRLCHNYCLQLSVWHTTIMLRVYLQVVRWTVLSNDMLQAKEWGWKMGNNSHRIAKTDQEPETAKALLFIQSVQVTRQEPLRNQTMLLSEKWTEMLGGLQ